MRITFALGVFFCTGAFAQESPIVLSPQPVTSNGAAHVTVVGPAHEFVRVDVSLDLLDWTALDLLPNPTGVASFSDDKLAQDGRRFYRAQTVAAKAGIARLRPRSGAPGTTVTIEGQFFAGGHPRDNIVTFGGVAGEVLTATKTTLTVVVPAGAISGPLTVQTPDGVTAGTEPFTVTGVATLRFEPPPGVDPEDYVIGNSYGSAQPANGLAPGGWLIPVREGVPLITMAVPADTNRQTFFFGLSVSSTQTFVLNAFSTAEAMVFLNPLVVTLEPSAAAIIRERIRRDAAVTNLAEMITLLFPQGGNPYADTNLHNAYTAAVISVLTNGPPGNGPTMARPMSQFVASVAPQVHSLDLEFTEIKTNAAGFTVEAKRGNPVDWVAVVQEVDLVRAFPGGRRQFFSLGQGLDEAGVPIDFPTVTAGVREKRLVSASAYSSYLGVLGALSKAAINALGDFDQPVRPTISNGVYLVRSIGPGFLPESESDFVTLHYPNERLEARIMNLVGTACDIAGALLDAELVEGDAKTLVLKTIAEATRSASSLRTLDDFYREAGALSSFVLKEATAFGIKALQAAPVVLINLASEKITVVLAVGDVLSAAGQVFERGVGLFRTTALESGLVVVGDPFRLQVLDINPSRAWEGDIINIKIHNGPIRNYQAVRFTRSQHSFYGTVLDVTPSGHDETIRVQLPSRLDNPEEGDYQVVVSGPQTEGSGLLRLIIHPRTRLTFPRQAYAAVPDFRGQPYRGSRLELRGVGFAAADDFKFPILEHVTDKGDLTLAESWVQIYVPENARSGPIEITRQVLGMSRVGFSDPVEILGSPVIHSVEPPAAFPSEEISLTLGNVGIDYPPEIPYVRFAGFPGELPLELIYSNRFKVTVPLGAVTGPLTVLTPAGVAAADFHVREPLSGAGLIYAGGPSKILTLQRAFDIAAGDLPEDDEDFTVNNETGEVTDTDIGNDNEEGDFVEPDFHLANRNLRWGVGRLLSDTVIVEGPMVGNAFMTSSEDAVIGGPIEGTVTVTANNNDLDIAIANCAGPGLVITGSNNVVIVRCTDIAGDGVRIVGGHFNTVSVWTKRCGGNGVVLTGNASHNSVYLVSGDVDVGTGALIPNSGNQGHGVWLNDGRHNRIHEVPHGSNIFGIAFSGIMANGGDGVRLDGAGVAYNIVDVFAAWNAGNGCTVMNRAHENLIGSGTIPNFNFKSMTNGGFGILMAGEEVNGNAIGRTGQMECSGNGRDGIGLFGSAARPVMLARLAAHCEGNAGAGLVLSNVVGTDPLRGIFLTAVLNQHAGLRVVGESSRLVGETVCVANGVGAEFVGPNVRSNNFGLVAAANTTNGVVVAGVQSNAFELDVEFTAGSGIKLTGATNNNLIISARDNAGDGVRVLGQSHNNDIRIRALLRNQNGLKLEDGAADNRVQFVDDDLGSSSNRAHGILVQGPNTHRNQLLNTVARDNSGDAIRIEGGAQDTEVMSVASALPSIIVHQNAGIRISGNTTTGTRIHGCWITGRNIPGTTGIIVEQMAGALIGGQPAGNRVSQIGEGILIRTGADNVFLEQNTIFQTLLSGVTIIAAGKVAVGGVNGGLVNDLFANPVGVDIHNQINQLTLQKNSFTGNGDGVRIQFGSSGVVVKNNFFAQNSAGLRIIESSRIQIRNNEFQGHAVHALSIASGSSDNLIQGNTVTRNPIGILISGGGTIRNRVTANSITAHAGKGIMLEAGGNHEQPPPTVEVTANAVAGQAPAPDGSSVEIYKDADDEGLTLIGTAKVVEGRYRTVLPGGLAGLGVLFRVNATVTDLEGNTSEFSLPPSPLPLPTSQVVFTSNRDTNREIYLLDGFLTADTRLTVHPAEDFSPMLSPDGQAMVFVSTRAGTANVYTAAPRAGASALLLTTNIAPAYSPSWSPAATNIVFVSETAGNPEIYTMRRNGTSLRRLTTNQWNDLSPAYSPDGRKVVFASDRAGGLNIYVMGVDGSNPVALAAHPASDYSPVWSPDGSSVAFVSDRGGLPQIYKVNADGSGLAQLTAGNAPAIDPAWLADGAGVIYSSSRDDGFELYAQWLSGGPPMRFTVSYGDNTQPKVRSR